MPTVGPLPTPSELAGQVIHLLSRAEALFGPRNSSYTFQGITFFRDGPCLVYPPGHLPVVQIALHQECVAPTYYPDQFLHQLSHEVVHLLEADGGQDGTMLEEGAAVWFSINEPVYWDDGYASLAHMDCLGEVGNYGVAYRHYLNLTAIEPDAVRLIRAYCRLGDVTADVIQSVAPTCPRSVAEELCVRRKMR